ncbi:transporter substrate-binding domain-containing protein [Vibrio profundum]|uniref:substrate-binding periplasmic protein n=1 Tax=Vibrio profundum TaxID=2910247 RepID=UPI003D10E6A2
MFLSKYLIPSLLLMSFTTGAQQVLTIARGNENYSPYEMKSVEGELYGFHIDLVKLAAKQAGYTVQFNSLPWKRAMQDAKDGAVDAILYISRTKEREQFLYYLDKNKISEVRFHFLINVKNQGDIKFSGDVDEILKGRMLLVQRGFSYGALVDNPMYKKHEVAAAEQLVNMIAKERSELGIMNIYGFNYMFRDQHQVITLGTPVKTKKAYIAFSRKGSSLEVTQRFADALEAVKGTEQYQVLLKRYLYPAKVKVSHPE